MSEQNAASKTYLPAGIPIPVPAHDGVDREFYEATRRHELVVQRCAKCGTFQFPAEWICHKCQTLEPGWERVSSRGRIYSWERVWHPAHPALKNACPYLVVVVELPDAGNVRMVGNLLGDPMQEVKFDAEVEAVFEDHEGATLVQWKVAR
ncbi:MAG: Zn-ribbon domain-containing OB-fold protein [Candidatus Binataceae bacterium]